MRCTGARGEAVNKIPFHGGRCYACNKQATGLRDKRPEEDDLEPACERHRDPSIETYDACLNRLDKYLLWRAARVPGRILLAPIWRWLLTPQIKKKAL